MQMISKNRNGITLISLIITIIVLLIIVGITVRYGVSEIHDVQNKKMESEVSIVQEAVMQRYALVKSENQLGKIVSSHDSDVMLANDTNRPKEFLGKRLANPKTTLGKDFASVTLIKDYTSATTGLTYEEYYYLLSESDLIALGIEKGSDLQFSNDTSLKGRSYIVNYFTGEVFDIGNKKYYKTDISDKDPIYKQPTTVDTTTQNYTFSDN